MFSLDNPWMIKRNFNSESYDQAFSEQAVKPPAFQQEFITKLTGERVQIFCSKHGLLSLSIINFIGIFVLLIFMMSQLHDIHQRIDDGRSKTSNLQNLVKVLEDSSEKNMNKDLFQSGAHSETELVSTDLNIRYLGLIQVGHSFKALIEIDEITSFFSKGQMISGHWLIKSFDQSQLILESRKGQQMTILLE